MAWASFVAKALMGVPADVSTLVVSVQCGVTAVPSFSVTVQVLPNRTVPLIARLSVAQRIEDAVEASGVPVITDCPLIAGRGR